MALHDLRLTVMTESDGTGTITAPMSIFGYLEAVEWIDGSFDDGVDPALSVTETPSGVDQTLLSVSNANADAWYRPRHVVHGEDGGALTGTSGGDRARPIINGVLKLAVTNGGDEKTGGCIVYYER